MINNKKKLTNKLAIAGSCLTILATGMSATSAIAAETEQARLSYNVYIGNSRMFKIGLITDLTAKTYHSAMKLKPKGLIAKLFANITMEMSVQGKLLKNAVKPEKFSFYRKKKKRKRTSKVSWQNPSQTSTSRSYKISASKMASLAKAINTKTPDPLSAFLRVGISDAKNPCSKNQRVYDGAKVYDLKFKLIRKTSFGSNSGGSYKGPVFECKLSHSPVAGYSSKDMNKLRKKPAIFTVWFAPVKSALLKRIILLPVAAAGKVKGRAFSAFVNKASFAGKRM